MSCLIQCVIYGRLSQPLDKNKKDNCGFLSHNSDYEFISKFRFNSGIISESQDITTDLWNINFQLKKTELWDKKKITINFLILFSCGGK